MSKDSIIRLRKQLLFIFILFLWAGCADDLRNRSVFDCGAGDAVIRFSVEDVILTRDGETEDIESVVDHAYLLFYSGDASLLTAVPVAAVKAEVDPAAPGNLKFKMPLSLTPNTDYQLLAIANADDYVPTGFESFGEYLESWCSTATSSDKSLLHLYSSTAISPADRSNLPMTGRLTESSTFRFSIDNGAYTVSGPLSFRRMVARIDVANIVREGFEVEGVALCNWRDAMPVASYDRQMGNRFGSVQGILSNDGVTLSEDMFVEMPLKAETETQQLKKWIYCFPSVSDNSHLGDQESTALIIKAKYGDDLESTYYRVNVGMDDNGSKVEPNTKYLVTIKSVKGRGASTPEEAYFATESQIVLSIVEGWDLDGNAFDMDDYGNFIVLSKGSLAFDGNSTDNVDVRILTSKGLSWNAEYIADTDASASAFKITKLSEIALSIGPNGVNDTESELSGKCCVSAQTSDGTTLMVNISLQQYVAEGIPYVPVIPDNMPFALIPESYDRVKIDHENKTIEIDGFDPDCFNSFIDIPFTVYVNPSKDNISQVTVDSNLEWPLEGWVSKQKHDDHFYCQKSFNVSGKDYNYVYSKSDNKELTKQEAIGSSSTFRALKGEMIYISVGAMAPDDPAIIRNVYLSEGGESVKYELTIRPRPCIIDDIILKDGSYNNYLVLDRNIQDPDKSDMVLDQIGKKYQSYNYSNLYYTTLSIPNKYKDSNSSFDETWHNRYKGKFYYYSKRNDLFSPTVESTGARMKWLKKYLHNGTSPFYEESDLMKWLFPDEEISELIHKKLSVSKMRMYLVSDYPAKQGKNEVPVCCYLPYECVSWGDSSNDTYGYFISNDGLNVTSMIIYYIDKCEMNMIKLNSLSSSSNHRGLSRLIRHLTSEELDNYKINYLGYGSLPHKLTICHPDTYTSESLGWLPN